MVTNVWYRPGVMTCLMSCIMSAGGVVGGLVPCFIDDCLDAHHYCGVCE